MRISLLRRFYSEKLKVCVIGKPNVGKSTLFNHLASYSNIGNKYEVESLVHPEPGLTRDCRDIDVKGVLPAPINFFDTPGIDFLIDKIKVRGLSLETFGNLFSCNSSEDVDKDSIWEFANFIQQGNTKDKKKYFQPWQREFLKILNQHKNSNINQFQILEHLLSPEQSITEFLFPLIFTKIEDNNSSLSKFALAKMVENASNVMENADLIFFMIDSKKNIDSGGLHLFDWIKFIFARQEITNYFNYEEIDR